MAGFYGSLLIRREGHDRDLIKRIDLFDFPANTPAAEIHKGLPFNFKPKGTLVNIPTLNTGIKVHSIGVIPIHFYSAEKPMFVFDEIQGVCGRSSEYEPRFMIRKRSDIGV